jgi:hypothetical protein
MTVDPRGIKQILQSSSYLILHKHDVESCIAAFMLKFPTIQHMRMASDLPI